MVTSGSDFVSLVDNFAPALRRLQQVSGVQTAVLFRGVAKTIGQELAKAMTSTSFDLVIDELELLFDSLGFGKISVERTNSSVTLTVGECLGCEQVPDAAGAANCALWEDMLKAIFEERLGVESDVTLLKSLGTEFGGKTCKFAVKLGKIKSE